jgi:hypothetical protein
MFNVWDITPCSHLKLNKHFGGTCYLYFQGQKISQVASRAQRYVRVDRILHNHRCENLKSYNADFQVLKNPRLYSLVLVEVRLGEGEVLGSEKGKVLKSWLLLWAQEKRWVGALLCVIGINFYINVGRSKLQWNFDVTTGRDACELCSARWNLSTNPEMKHYRSVGRVNCCWSSPAQSFLFRISPDLLTYFTVSWLWEDTWILSK